jgi:hypothetical protein
MTRATLHDNDDLPSVQSAARDRLANEPHDEARFQSKS